MRRLLLVSTILTMLAVACSGEAGPTTTTTTVPPDSATSTVTAAPPATTRSTQPEVRRQNDGESSLLAITEIGLGDGGYVALTNFTSVDVSLEGLVLCQRPGYFDLPAETVAAGETVLVAVGDGSGLEGRVVATSATIGPLRPEDGEIALYLGRAFGDPGSILQYLEWGSTPHARNPVAIEAGIWIADSFAPTAADATRLYRNDSGLWLFATD